MPGPFCFERVTLLLDACEQRQNAIIRQDRAAVLDRLLLATEAQAVDEAWQAAGSKRERFRGTGAL